MKARREIVRSIAGWQSRRSAIRRATGGPPAAPFVVGATRSGTTLLRLMLDAHPGISIPSETHFIPELISAREKHGASSAQMLELLTSHRRWGDFTIEADELAARWATLDPLTGPAAVRAFYELYADKQGNHGARWGDKTPGYIKSMREIQVYLPEARFIHLIRDGRDVALSILKQHWGPQTIEAAAEKWRSRVLRGRAQQPYLGFYLEVKFEDLVLHTERELRRICGFIDLDFDPAMLGYHETAEQRLQEKARALPRAHGEPQSAEKRLMSHAKTFEPPNPELIGTWRKRMSALRPGRLRGARRRPARRDRLRGRALPTAPARSTGRGAGRGCRGRCVARSRSPSRQPASAIRAEPRTPGADPDRRRPIRHRPARRDARRPLRSGDAARNRLRPAARRDDPLRADDGRAGDQVDGRGRSARGARASRGGDAAAADRARRPEGGRGAALTFYEAAAENAGKTRWGDDTPSYLKRMRRIQRALSEARFIHVVRDGRDTLAAQPAAINTGAAIATGQRWSKKVRSAQQSGAPDGLVSSRSATRT